MQCQGPGFLAIVSWDKRDTWGHLGVNGGVESEVRWSECFGCPSAHGNISAVESAVGMSVPNLSLFPPCGAGTAAAGRTVEALLKDVVCASLSGFSTCCLHLLPRRPSNKDLPKPTLYTAQPSVCRQRSHSSVQQFVTVSKSLLLQTGMLRICCLVTVGDSLVALQENQINCFKFCPYWKNVH